MAGASDKKRVVLKVTSGAVVTGSDPEISKQAYRLDIAPGLIEVTGNSDQGLFYGVQTLLQLLKPGQGGSAVVALGDDRRLASLQTAFPALGHETPSGTD